MESERFWWRWMWRSGKVPRWRWWTLYNADIQPARPWRGLVPAAIIGHLGSLEITREIPVTYSDFQGNLFIFPQNPYEYRLETAIPRYQLTWSWTRTIASTVQISGRQLNSIDQEINDSSAVELITILICRIESSLREDIPPPLIDTLLPAPFSDCFLARGGAHGGGNLGYLSTSSDLKIFVNYFWSWQTERCYHLLSGIPPPRQPLSCPVLTPPTPLPPPNARWSVKECDL